MQMLLPLVDFLLAIPPDCSTLNTGFQKGFSRAHHMLKDTLSPLHLHAVGAIHRICFLANFLISIIFLFLNHNALLLSAACM
jgi:hypothetical protein